MSAYLAQSNKNPTLANVIAAADATNHAIPTPNELSQAFTKLVNAGVLEVKENSYMIRSEHLSGIERAYRSKGGLFESANKGKKWLNTSKLDTDKMPKITVTQDEVNNAYKVYTSKSNQKG
jgi:hypothetical protein